MDLIAGFGYGISLLFPYKAMVEPMPNGFPAALPPRAMIQARTRVGKITIDLGAGLLRTIRWNRLKREIELSPWCFEDNGHRSSCFIGHQRWTGYCWQRADGFTRRSYREGVQDFGSQESALAWIRERKNEGMPLVYTSKGLVAGWYKDQPFEAIYVDLYQLTIQGKIPTDLPGSEDRKITVTESGPNAST
jgi:hypothetical protein